MKDDKVLKQDRDREPSAERKQEKLKDVKNVTDFKLTAQLASALAQATVPQYYGTELFQSLSSLGNHNFLNALEREEKRRAAARLFAEQEILSPEKRYEIRKRLSDNTDMKENRINRLPEEHTPEPLPGLLSDESVRISSLTPAAFDRFFADKLPDTAAIGQYPYGMSGGEVDG